MGAKQLIFIENTRYSFTVVDVGVGHFLLPFAHEVVGPGMWFAFILAGSVVIASASEAELASAMPQSGGFYVYAERTYGYLVGTISGLGLFASFMWEICLRPCWIRSLQKVVSTIAAPKCQQMPLRWCFLRSFFS